MVALDTFHNNLCFWRCIAVLRGALPHRRTQAAIELAKSSFNLRTVPLNVPKTSLDELDKVERHFRKGKQFQIGLALDFVSPNLFKTTKFCGISERIFLVNEIMTKEIYEGHALLIKDS